jgi:hypothetical protein
MNRGKHENSKLLKELLRISWSEAAIIGIWTYIHEREICSVYGFSCDSDSFGRNAASTKNGMYVGGICDGVMLFPRDSSNTFL